MATAVAKQDGPKAFKDKEKPADVRASNIVAARGASR